MRSVRSRADVLGLDYSHFSTARLTSERLRAAVSDSETWGEVIERLGLRGASGIAAARGHAARLGVDVAHLAPRSESAIPLDVRPDTVNLPRAGSLLAAAWFTLCGQEVSWPLEPSRYDLLVQSGEGIRRVQVKTTTVRAGDTWKVYLSTAGRGRRTYDPDEIDDFFVIDGSLTYFQIPLTEVGGRQAIHLSAYERFRLRPVAFG